MIRIQATPTWQCNYYDHKKGAPHGSKCAYCNLYSIGSKDTSLQLAYGKTLPIRREMNAAEWATGAEVVHTATGEGLLWDFTGGEPLLYEALPDMLTLVAPYSRWAVTSNTSLRKRIKRLFEPGVAPCSSWTASWHPMAGAGIDEFVDNLKLIRDHGVYVSITVVLHPTTMHCIKEHLERFEAEGFVRQVHMHLGGIDTEGGMTEHPSRVEVSEGLRSEIADVARSIEYLSRPVADDWARSPEQFPPPNDCIAAYRSIAVSADGSVFPCYNAMMVEDDPPIGQWGEWVPNVGPTRGCTWNCVFGCDLRNVLPAAPM